MVKNRFSILLLVAILAFSGCATKKRRGDVSKLGKFYHNTTAKFNGYFNANVIYEESLLLLKDAHKDNYTQILPLYPESDVQDAGSVASELDRGVEKLAVVISLHRVSEWTDDSYLLMGKTQYLKKDYEAAEETLEFFEDEFDPVNIKKKNKKVKAKKSNKERKKERKAKEKDRDKERKEKLKERKRRIKARKKGKRLPPVKKEVKEEEKKDEETKPSEAVVKQEEEQPEEAKSGVFVHENVYPEGLLWLARTYIEREKFSLARSTMNKLALMPMTDDVIEKVPLVEAYYFLKQKQYRAALPKLIQSVEISGTRDDKARYAFIVAQIYQLEGSLSQAIEYYSECLKNGPDYEMEFHARLNRLILERAGGQISDKELQNQLSRMLRDDKNIEYSGYIHLALATAAERAGDEGAALQHLKDALASNDIDEIQRSEAYLRIADIYFARDKYADAKDYYDSTKTFLKTTDPRAGHVDKQLDLLTDIAKNIRIIELQDSLLRISKMSLEDKKKIAAELKAKEIAQRERASSGGDGQAPSNRRLPVNKRFPGSNATALAQGGAGTLSSNFFGYDPRLIKKGQREFEKKWGDRPLEDDWRRSNKRTVSFFAEEEEEDQQEEESLDQELSIGDVNRLLSGVPNNPKEIAEAERKISDALFDLGKLYRDKMLNDEKCVETLESLIDRFPDSKHTYDAWYLLYLSHNELGNTTEAKKYADLIVEKNPDSKYAQVILDPDYANKMLSEEEKLVQYYDDTYEKFSQGYYQEAFNRIEQSAGLFGQDNQLVPRFALLKAMCLGKIDSKESYVTGLKEVIAKYPGSPEAVRAKEIMRFLQGDDEAFQTVSEADLVNTSFVEDDQSLHYVITVLFDLGENSLDQAKIAAANYNRENYRNRKFRVAHNMLSIEPATPLILIRKFDSKSDALSYTSRIEDNPEAFMPKGVNFEVYAITQQNYREVMKQRSVNKYRLFYAKNYREL